MTHHSHKDTSGVTRKPKISGEDIRESEDALDEVYKDEIDEAYENSDHTYPSRPHRPLFKNVSIFGIVLQLVVVSGVVALIAGIVFYAPHFLTSGFPKVGTEVVTQNTGLEDALVPTALSTSTDNSVDTSVATSSPVVVKDKVKISETETGWLNVRATPSASGLRVTRVSPKEIYEYKEIKNGWYLIVIDAKTQGWVSGEYVTEVK